MWFVAFLIATAGAGVSLCVHILTFVAPAVGAELGDLAFLAVGAMIVVAPAVIIVALSGRQQSWREMWAEVSEQVPRWKRVLTLLIFIYAGFNFFHTIYLNQGGQPTVEDGQYLLIEHGRTIAQLTKQEYRKHQAYVVRSFSGHWVVGFWFAIVVYFVGMSDERRWNVALFKQSNAKLRH